MPISRIKKRLLGPIILSVFVWIGVNGQNLQKDTINLDQILVTGTKTAIKRQNHASTVTTITREAIESSSESSLLPIIGDLTPGVFITKRGITGFGISAGSAGQISIRGIGGSPTVRNLVLLNGHPQFAGIFGHPLADAYVASDVEKVEIIRGPSSTLYGSNAMGGLINIITRKPEKKGFSSNARLMYGSFDTRKYSANIGYNNNGLNIIVSYNHDQTDGHRDKSDFNIDNGYIRLEKSLGEHFMANADFSLAKYETWDPGPFDGESGYGIDILRGMGAFGIENSMNRSSGSIKLFYNFGDHDVTDGFHSLDRNFGLMAHQSFHLLDGNTITIGLDHKQYGGLAENLNAMEGMGMVFGDTLIMESAVYVYIQQILFQRISISSGFRLENSSIYGIEPVPSAGITYHYGDDNFIRANISKGFRSPTMQELFLWKPANQELEPERMLSLETGIYHQFLDNKLSVDISGFIAKGDNMIKMIFNEDGPKFMNSGSFNNRGIEVDTRFRILNNFTATANYSFTKMENPVIATPAHQLYAGLDYRLNKFGVHISGQYINDLIQQITPVLVSENYLLFNARIKYQVNKFAGVFIKGENLGNREYSINYKYPMPGRIFFVGLNLNF